MLPSFPPHSAPRRFGIPRRRDIFLSFLVVFLLLTLVTHQYWLYPANTLPSPSRDLKSNLLPIVMYKTQVAAGEFPWRSPWYSSEPNLYNPLWNFLYVPATLLFLGFPLGIGVRLVIALHIAAGWLTMFLLLRRFTDRAVSAVFGAFLYVFSGIWAAALVSYHFEKIFGLALLPLVFLGFKLSYESPTRRHALLCGLALAGMVYAGSMYLLTFALAGLLFMAILLWFERRLAKAQAVNFVLALLMFVVFSSP